MACFIYQAPFVMTHCFQLKTGINWPLLIEGAGISKQAGTTRPDEDKT